MTAFKVLVECRVVSPGEVANQSRVCSYTRDQGEDKQRDNLIHKKCAANFLLSATY